MALFRKTIKYGRPYYPTSNSLADFVNSMQMLKKSLLFFFSDVFANVSVCLFRVSYIKNDTHIISTQGTIINQVAYLKAKLGI